MNLASYTPMSFKLLEAERGGRHRDGGRGTTYGCDDWCHRYRTCTGRISEGVLEDVTAGAARSVVGDIAKDRCWGRSEDHLFAATGGEGLLARPEHVRVRDADSRGQHHCAIRHVTFHGPQTRGCHHHRRIG